MNDQPQLPEKEGFLDRAMRNLRLAWGKIAGGDNGDLAARLGPDLSGGDRARLIEQMRACLEGRGGEVSARARAAALGRAYLALNATGRRRFLDVLATEFDVDHEAIAKSAAALARANDAEKRAAVEKDLKTALEAPRVRLLTQFNGLPEGVKFLVDLRQELSALAREDASLRGLERDLKTLLTSWFDIGFLELRQITWNAPAALLEKLIAYEAVHEIRSWDDMKNRLAADRRCFAFFHPRMPDEPLIFVWVALVKGIAGNIQELLDESAPMGDAESADAAIFYSITSAQPGLRGISFGSFLIKRVADDLSAELKGLKTFVTLSPVPGFRTWLDQEIDAGAEGAVARIDAKSMAPALAAAATKNPGEAIRTLLARPNWHQDPEVGKALETPLMKLCARYLAMAKAPGGTAKDSVAHFHLSNGARMERLNWMADLSPRGIEQSAGVMINYLYELDKVETRHEAYSDDGEVTTSSRVADLIKE